MIIWIVKGDQKIIRHQVLNNYSKIDQKNKVKLVLLAGNFGQFYVNIAERWLLGKNVTTADVPGYMNEYYFAPDYKDSYLMWITFGKLHAIYGIMSQLNKKILDSYFSETDYKFKLWNNFIND